MTPKLIERYVALGDSLTEGVSDWRAADPNISFVAVLAEQLRHAAPRLTVTNLGVGGARTADVLNRQVPTALNLSPDLVTLVVGANDVPSTPAAQFQRTYTEVIARLREGVAGTIVIANLPDFTHLLPPQYAAYSTQLTQRITSFNQIIAATAAAHNILLVDLHSDAAPHDPLNVSGDGLHPTARGYRAMARAFAQTLNATGYNVPLPSIDPVGAG